MTPYQVMIVGLCFIITMLDGMDVMVIAFVAPQIAREWGLEPMELGFLFSIGVFGMMVGSLFLGPVADQIGRRSMIIGSLLLTTAAMIGAAFTTDIVQLGFARFMIGAGIGAMLPSLNTHVAEYASNQGRGLSVSIMQIGYPIGATIGGIVAGYMLMELGWRSVFLASALLSVIMIPMIYFLLPESIDFLIARKPGNALIRMNRILARLARSSGDHDFQNLDRLPEAESRKAEERASVASLLSKRYRLRSILIWTAFATVSFTLTFIMNWTPQILVESGFQIEQGISGGVILNIGGILGSLVLGTLTLRYALRKVTAAYLLLGVLMMTIFGVTNAGLTLMMVMVFLVGFCVFACMIGLYTILPNLYPAAIRNTGAGWAIGLGRIGSIAGPYVAGVLIAEGLGREFYYFLLSLPLVIACVAVLNLRQTQEW